MQTYKIAVGRSRKETHWQTWELRWRAIADRLKKALRTDETVAEYAAAGKAQRAAWKDVGGFVGGPVEGGRRKRGTVKLRYLITLDMDEAKAGAWDEVQLNYATAAVLYATHSSTPEKPRYRLVMPLSRPVTPEEYEAIARGVAATLGADRFDPSTYEPERLMYWPSVSRDADYEFYEQEGAPLDADEMLHHYRDWRATWAWSISERERNEVAGAIKKQGDPTEKPGAVGRFCRAYDVPEAIDAFLADVYLPTTQPGRYTYAGGTTVGGLVVYDGGAFAYSHHGTDPVQGRLLNAFDLVRLHRFASLDDEAAPGTPVNRLPSYLAMEDFAANDARVQAEDDAERMAKVREDFAGLEETADDSWMKKLRRDKKGAPSNCAENAVVVAQYAPGMRDNLWRDLLARRDYIRRDLPWRKIESGDLWTDADDANWRVYLSKYGVTTKQYALDAIEITFARNAVHPVRQYLEGLPAWDGVPRLDTVFTDRLGAEDDPLTRAVARKVLTAAVARILGQRRGGVKFDYCVVLSGQEGIGKSTLVRELFAPWFNDSVTTLAGKEAMEQIQGAWGVELGELSAVRRADLEGVKAFLSRQEDRFRPAYGRNVVVAPRQCVFFATTNEREFLKGDTGNRRFWVVDCLGRKCDPLTEETREQLWAEAVMRWKAGEPLYLTPEQEHEMRDRQASHNEAQSDPRPGMIEAYLETALPSDWARRDLNARTLYLADDESQEREGVQKRNKVCAAEIQFELFHQRADGQSKYAAKEINAILETLPGWERSKEALRFGPYGKQRGYIRKSE